MARLRVFVSSTCYDLDILRSELRPFIINMGYEPVMSEYSDVLFDPRLHTHDSCLKEVPSCDMMVLIIGSRFGGKAVPSALASVDFAALESVSTKSALLEAKEKLSITQLEVLKAVEHSVPVYAFVDDRVLHDHHVYEKNKDKPEVIEAIEFPSIQKRETAKYVFEFINFLGHRVMNNSITGFTRLEEIRTHLLSQWSQLFQRLLSESRTQTHEAKRYRDFSERLDDLKAVVLASLASPHLRDTAKGAVQFRHLINFVSHLRSVDHRQLLLSKDSWNDLLKRANVVDIRATDDRSPFACFLILEDQTFYMSRISQLGINELAAEWEGFQKLEHQAREAIVDALLEDSSRRGLGLLRYVAKPFDDWSQERSATLKRLEDRTFQDPSTTENAPEGSA